MLGQVPGRPDVAVHGAGEEREDGAVLGVPQLARLAAGDPQLAERPPRAILFALEGENLEGEPLPVEARLQIDGIEDLVVRHRRGGSRPRDRRQDLPPPLDPRGERWRNGRTGRRGRRHGRHRRHGRQGARRGEGQRRRALLHLQRLVLLPAVPVDVADDDLLRQTGLAIAETAARIRREDGGPDVLADLFPVLAERAGALRPDDVLGAGEIDIVGDRPRDPGLHPVAGAGREPDEPLPQILGPPLPHLRRHRGREDVREGHRQNGGERRHGGRNGIRRCRFAERPMPQKASECPQNAIRGARRCLCQGMLPARLSEERKANIR